MKLTAWFGKKSNKVCPCCNGVGEHETGFECYLCDSGGDVPEGTSDDERCDGTYKDGGESHGGHRMICVYPHHPGLRSTAGEYTDPPKTFSEHTAKKSWVQHRQYASEWRAEAYLPKHEISSPEESQSIADKVTKAAGVRPITVEHDPSYNYSFQQDHPHYGGRSRIVLGQGGTNHMTLLHELAHHVDREKGSYDPREGHGESFHNHMLDVVREHHPQGQMAEWQLKDSFHSTDRAMRMGMEGDLFHNQPNPEMTEKDKALPEAQRPAPLWGDKHHDPLTRDLANFASDHKDHYPKHSGGEYQRLDPSKGPVGDQIIARSTDKHLSQGLSPSLIHPQHLEHWLQHHPDREGLKQRWAEHNEYDDYGDMLRDIYGDETHHTAVRKQAAEDPDDPGLIHRGLTVVLPHDIHHFVHDENQPAPARAQMLLAHVRKAKPEITSEEAQGTTGGLGNYWSPRKEKAAEYGDQGGWGAYHGHEREHGCGNEHDGYGGCPTTHVVLHAGTPPEKHHWTENFRDGERYDPEHSWRLPVRPDSKLMVHGISWKQGHDNESGTHRDFSAEKAEPYSRYDFLRPMRKRAGANGGLPEGLQLGFTPHYTNESWLPRPDTGKRDTFHKVTAHVRGPDGQPVYAGEMSWYPHTGEVALARVPAQFRRRGIGTAMWDHGMRMAKEQGLTPPRHSTAQTDDGEAWAQHTSSYVPPGTMGTDSEGHGVQMTVMDGWAHRDGSHGHTDGPDIGDKPVYTQDHTWLPNGRYWGPNSAQNDQRLFEGDHLRPEVRQDILDRVGGVLGAYGDWEKWTRVYFAGSEAAQWQPFNGDFDVLIGINFEEFRDCNPHFEEMEDAEIASTLTEELWSRANAKEYYFTLADGRSVGPFDRTFFVNPRAWDIKNLHPYAAYNVTDDDWAVHPLQVPQDWDAQRLPESYWGYAEALLNEIQAIGQLPPEERHRMAANLYEELHSHRSDAFADGGHGLFDLSNIIEKYLDQHPGKPWEQLVQWKNESPSGPEPWVPTTARRTTLTTLFEPKTAADGADYGGVMIALVPPKKICKKLAQEDGEPVDAMHVTLAYMPGQDRRKAARELPKLVEGWARTQKALTARIGGVGTFVNPGQHVLWAAVDIPHGGPFRQSLVETLERHGYEVANDHGWTPHITLDYRDDHVRFLPKVEPATWDVTEVHICVGDNWTAVPLG